VASAFPFLFRLVLRKPLTDVPPNSASLAQISLRLPTAWLPSCGSKGKPHKTGKAWCCQTTNSPKIRRSWARHYYKPDSNGWNHAERVPGSSKQLLAGSAGSDAAGTYPTKQLTMLN
jgi:hypothetical protein